jgi:hypothetical protein
MTALLASVVGHVAMFTGRHHDRVTTLGRPELGRLVSAGTATHLAAIPWR